MMQRSEANSQSRALAENSARTEWRPVVGFLVADAALKPLYTNDEAIAILTYPGPSRQAFADIYQRKVRPGLMSAHTSAATRDRAHTVMKFRSGRRTYFCRVFPLDSNGGVPNGTATLVILERGVSGPLALSQVSQQFHLTHREHQAVGLLLRGLSNKEIAESMSISTNTVKAFLRMATIKMGATTRSGIVTKILGLLLSSDSSDLDL